MTTNKPACPKCGSQRTAIIIGGYPTPEAEEMVQRGEAVHGGCMPWVGEGPSPTHRCKDCDAEFRAAGEAENVGR